MFLEIILNCYELSKFIDSEPQEGHIGPPPPPPSLILLTIEPRKF